MYLTQRAGQPHDDLLQVEDLNVWFRDGEKLISAVKHVSFSVGAGEIVGMIGRSGSGKSTVMRAVMGLLPEQAEVSFARCGMKGGGQEMSMVFQDPFSFLNPTVRVGRQLTETIQVHHRKRRRLTKAELTDLALEYLELAGIRQGKQILHQYPFELSGGQRQRIVLAIALACDPRLLIADELTTALDVTVQRQILDRLKRIAEETRTAILIVSHDFGVIAAMAERVLIMKDGQITGSGNPEDIFYHPQDPYTAGLIQSATASHVFMTGEKREDELLRAENLTCRFHMPHTAARSLPDTREAVRQLSFQIQRGETYGLAGESGCGKTTLARMLTGIITPTEGQLYFQGTPLPSLKKGRTAEQIRKIQMVFQDTGSSLDPRCTIEEILREPLDISRAGTAAQRKGQVEKMLVLAGLQPEDARKYPHAFSGGQRQRIGIARALITDPELLVLDEPVSALDPSIQEQILELLARIQRERRLSCLFISHDLNVVRRMSARIGIMFEGRLVETGDTEEVYAEPWHPYTKELLRSILTADPRKARRTRPVRQVQERDKIYRPSGCPYAPRCGYAMKCCHQECPSLYHFEERSCMCFLYSERHTGKQSRKGRMRSQI